MAITSVTQKHINQLVKSQIVIIVIVIIIIIIIIIIIVITNDTILDHSFSLALLKVKLLPREMHLIFVHLWEVSRDHMQCNARTSKADY